MNNRIAIYRSKQGIKTRELAFKLGWGSPRLSNYENERRTPSLDDCRKIVAGLNALGVACTIDDVFPPAANDEFNGGDAA